MPIPDPISVLYRIAKGLRNYGRPGRLAFDRMLRRPTVQVTDRATGLTFRCLREADRMFGETFHSLVYDVPTAPVGPGDVVIDVGANHGFTACHFAHRGAEVLAIEPHPGVFPLLLENVRANDLEDRVRPIRRAVSDRRGTATLLATERFGGGMSSLDRGFIHSTRTPVAERYEVDVTSLADLVRDHDLDRVRLVKLDCEGSELEILRSLDAETLERIDSFALEYHANAYPLGELLEVVLGWDGFSVSKAMTRGTTNANLHVVARRTLREWAARG